MRSWPHGWAASQDLWHPIGQEAEQALIWTEKLKSAVSGAAFSRLLCHTWSNSCSSPSKPIKSIPSNNKKVLRNHIWAERDSNITASLTSSQLGLFQEDLHVVYSQSCHRAAQSDSFRLDGKHAQGSLIWFNPVYLDSLSKTRHLAV